MEEIECRDYGCGGSEPRRLKTIERASRAPRRPWWERPDLYWQPQLYEFQPRWREHGRGVAYYRTDALGRQVYDMAWVPDFEPLSSSRLLRHSEHVKGVVAALAAFHQMTAGQLAAHLGFPFSKIGYVLLPMFDAGLVERASYPKQGPWQPRLDYVYRLRIDEPLETWLADLDEPDWLAVTLGAPIGHAGHFVRHNLLVSEALLRLEEVAAAPLQIVYGERFAGTDRLFGAGSSRHAIFGDACVVREDGLRIVIELVRRQRANETEKKMAKWAELLSRAPLSALGTVVVFVNASLPGRDHVDRATSLRRCHKRTLSPERLSTGFSGAIYARAAIFLASFEEWFPRPGSISTDFAQLVVCHSADGTTWGRGALLPGEAKNVLPFAPAQPSEWAKPGRVNLDPGRAAGVTEARGTRYLGVPSWLNGPIGGPCVPMSAPAEPAA